jgi:hypothetical protein
MSITTPVHKRNLDHAILRIAQEAADLKMCGHGKTWKEDCPECCAVWREDRIKDLYKQAAKYGFKLIPIE